MDVSDSLDKGSLMPEIQTGDVVAFLATVEKTAERNGGSYARIKDGLGNEFWVESSRLKKVSSPMTYLSEISGEFPAGLAETPSDIADATSHSEPPPSKGIRKGAK